MTGGLKQSLLENQNLVQNGCLQNQNATKCFSRNFSWNFNQTFCNHRFWSDAKLSYFLKIIYWWLSLGKPGFEGTTICQTSRTTNHKCKLVQLVHLSKLTLTSRPYKMLRELTIWWPQHKSMINPKLNHYRVSPCHEPHKGICWFENPT